MKFKSFLLTILLGAVMVASSHAATFTVTKLEDTGDGACDADCSLREAITAANSDARGDVIVFSGLSGVIQLTQSLPTIVNAVEIRGPGANLLTVRGEGATGRYRIFTIYSRFITSAPVVISGLTIANGYGMASTSPEIFDAGGGIYCQNFDLNLKSCVITGNQAALGGGVALLNGSLSRIYECTFSSNLATGDGGAIYLNNACEIRDSTLSGNRANRNGGALSSSGTAFVTFSTFVNNRADADGIDNGSGAGMGGAIADYDGGSSFQHTIFFNNQRGRTNAVPDSVAALYPWSFTSSQGYNLTDEDAEGLFVRPGDIISTDPQLGSLQNNGGPTPTHALLRGSPAINAGNPDYSPPPGDYDQRGIGFPRVVDGRVDIGAFEVTNSSNLAVSINNVSVKETNLSTTANFAVTLSAPAPLAVKVNYNTLNASAVAPNDYTTASGTITFAPGETKKTLAIFVNGDTLDEASEFFRVNLSHPVNTGLGGSQGIATIIDDDSAPSISIDDASVTEGHSGTKNLTFTVSLSKTSGQTISVNYATADGIARSTNDYVAKSGTLTFAPGAALTQTINITINGDTTVEGDETLYLLLSGATHASVERGRATGTVLNDDNS